MQFAGRIAYRPIDWSGNPELRSQITSPHVHELFSFQEISTENHSLIQRVLQCIRLRVIERVFQRIIQRVFQRIIQRVFHPQNQW